MAVQDEIRNRLLRRLGPDDLRLLSPHLKAVDLPRHMVLEETGREIEFVYFLESGLCSVVVGNRDLKAEAGHIGFEGATGTALVHGTSVPDAGSFMQIGGRGWRISASDLLSAMETMPDLRLVLLLFAQSLTTQITHSLLATAKFKIQQRLARWLLMCHDRTRGDTLFLTHEFLALMLAVRRASVTLELQMLEGQGLIKAMRGSVAILDRDGLVELAGGSYGIPEREYERLFADFP
jgi:CRP-like cAMP-binding protein